MAFLPSDEAFVLPFAGDDDALYRQITAEAHDQVDDFLAAQREAPTAGSLVAGTVRPHMAPLCVKRRLAGGF